MLIKIFGYMAGVALGGILPPILFSSLDLNFGLGTAAGSFTLGILLIIDQLFEFKINAKRKAESEN